MQRIYGSPEFAAQPFGPSRWLGDGSAYTTVEPAADGAGKDIVRYDVERGSREILIPARRWCPRGDDAARDRGLRLVARRQELLVFTNTQPVWRLNTRGDYWVLDRDGRHAQEAGRRRREAIHPACSPSSRPTAGGWGTCGRTTSTSRIWRAARITALTTDGSRTLINGTFDWVYEEELMNYNADGWRWSPDGSSIAYWQLNADSVRNFYLVNNTDSLYSQVTPVQYPKVGETNSAARVGRRERGRRPDPVAGDRGRSPQPLHRPDGVGRPPRPRCISSGSTGCRTATR